MWTGTGPHYTISASMAARSRATARSRMARRITVRDFGLFAALAASVLVDGLALMDWMPKYVFPAEAKTVSPEFVRVGTRLAALEMIESGTTTFADMYYFEEEIAKTVRDAGLRGILGQTIIQFPVADAKTPAEGLARAERFIREFKENGLVVPAVAPHALYTNDRATLVASAELARQY